VRIFLDTNVLASALATRGLCADILRQVIASHTIVVSEPLLIELRRVLTKKFKVPASLSKDITDFFSPDVIEWDASEVLDVSIKDRDDVVILSSAYHGGAELFVTGDKEILGLSQIKGMKIVSPREFWNTKRREKKA